VSVPVGIIRRRLGSIPACQSSGDIAQVRNTQDGMTRLFCRFSDPRLAEEVVQILDLVG